MKRYCWHLLIGISLIFSSQLSWAEAGSISIEAKVDRAKITIGDRIRYSIVVTRSDSIQVEMPEFGLSLGMFEILDYEDPTPQRLGGKIVQIREFIISTFDVGEFEIPPVGVRFAAVGDSNWQELKTEKIKIEVESLKPSEEGDIRDVKAPYEIERNWSNIIRLGIAALAVILIGIMLFFFIKRRREGRSLILKREKPPRPSHEIALEELDRLVQSTLLADGETKEFYVQLSDIIRTYFEGRYFIIALEMTTYQLIANMQEADVDGEIVALTKQLLNQCDLVKFAKHRPAPEEADPFVQIAYEIVNKSKLLPQFEEGANKADTENTRLEEKQEAESVDGAEVVSSDESGGETPALPAENDDKKQPEKEVDAS